MDKKLNEILKPLKYFILIIILGLIFTINIFNHQYLNVFEISLNKEDLGLQYQETITKWNFSKDVYNDKYQPENYKNNNYYNKFSINDKYILDFKEYEVYDKNGIRSTANRNKIGWKKSNLYDYIEVNKSKIKLKIQKDGKTLYNNKYINDISNYLNEEGTYYLSLSINRNIGLLKSIKTYITFNIVIDNNS